MRGKWTHLWEEHLEQCLLRRSPNANTIIITHCHLRHCHLNRVTKGSSKVTKNHLCGPSPHSKGKLGRLGTGLQGTAKLLPDLSSLWKPVGPWGEVVTNFRKFYSCYLHLEFPLIWISPSFLNKGNPRVTSLKHWISCYMKLKKVPIWFLKIAHIGNVNRYACNLLSKP